MLDVLSMPGASHRNRCSLAWFPLLDGIALSLADVMHTIVVNAAFAGGI